MSLSIDLLFEVSVIAAIRDRIGVKGPSVVEVGVGAPHDGCDMIPRAHLERGRGPEVDALAAGGELLEQ